MACAFVQVHVHVHCMSRVFVTNCGTPESMACVTVGKITQVLAGIIDLMARCLNFVACESVTALRFSKPYITSCLSSSSMDIFHFDFCFMNIPLLQLGQGQAFTLLSPDQFLCVILFFKFPPLFYK